MRRPLVKICGIRNPHEAAFCADIGVDMIGLNFVPGSKRKIDLDVAKGIMAEKGKLKAVGVFQNQPIEEVNFIADEAGLDLVQLSGDEDLDYVKQCNRSVIKGFSIGRGDDLGKIGDYKEHVEFILIDGANPGDGKVFDWGHLKELGCLDGGCDVFVAGGLNEDNVGELVKTYQPLGVDVASGVETLGQIDLGKINSFIEEVRP